MLAMESQIEKDLIQKLEELKYTYRRDILDRYTLEVNFREKFQLLNRVKLTDEEFARLLEEIVTPDVFTAAQTLRTRNSFIRADGTPLNYTLVNIDDWCKNSFEVIHQLRISTDYSHHRFDVILLINGVPVVQIELKTLSINPRRAIEQIVEYKNDPGNGFARTLLCFMQVFVVSNQHSTYYFANNNVRHFSFNVDERFLPIYQFAAPDNTKINGLDEFASAFLAKCTLGQMISRYMVMVASEQKLLMMRPYQIYAVKNIVKCIEENSGNGYIWHTTGSGKTLTSFKASTLLKANPAIQKCLFVVDRKDLDRQTREEFNRFQEGCVESNTNTGELVRRLLSDDAADKVIVCTIQKLGLALNENSKRNKSREKRGFTTYTNQLGILRDKRIIFIFDECHRSQFGENHQTIKEFFPKAQMFGFTGTPIFALNSAIKQITGEEQTLKTTEDLFQQCLHEYTITHAIEDRNVLKFHVDYFKPDGKNTPKLGERVSKRAIVEAILKKHDAATGGRKFNAIFATASINDAIEYAELFKIVQAEKIARGLVFVPLNIATVFSPPAKALADDPQNPNPNGAADVRQIQEDLVQENEDNQLDPEGKQAALSAIIAEYNERFGTNHSVYLFDLYYQDVQQRIKDQQWSEIDLRKAAPQISQHKLDITIVVDMLLTGFDSKYLNTLYVDKSLKYHGLIQAFSRTNRVLNDTKPHGHILDFRGQQGSVDDAIALFSGAKADRAREIWLVDKAPIVIEKLQEAKLGLQSFMRAYGLTGKPEDAAKLMGNEARVGFVKAFKDVQKLQTQLDQYTDLTPEQLETIETILPKVELNAFRGQYLETAKRLRDERVGMGSRADDVRNEELAQLDFEFVLFASTTIDYDYIMKLVADFSSSKPGKAIMNREQLISLISGDARFIDERQSITEYVMSLKAGGGLDEHAIRAGYQQFKAVQDGRELAKLSDNHGLPAEALQSFVNSVLERRIFDAEELTVLLAPLELGWKSRVKKEVALMTELGPYLKRCAGEREIFGLNVYED